MMQRVSALRIKTFIESLGISASLGNLLIIIVSLLASEVGDCLRVHCPTPELPAHGLR